jgi:hypothetical protein
MLDDDICRTQPGSPICSAERWWLQNLYNSGLASFESISNIMDNVAMAITDSARAQPFPGVSYVSGTIWHTTICTEFNWPWLIFPAALIILAALSLASTVGSGAMLGPVLCSEHQKSGASDTPPPAAATVDSIMKYLGGGLYIYQSTNICSEF